MFSAPWILIRSFLWILLSMCVCWCIKVHEVLIIIYCSRANHPSFVSRMLIKNMCSNDVSYFRNVKCSDAKQNSNQFYLSLGGSLLLLLCLYKRLHPAIKPLAFTPISSNIKRKINDNTLLPSENLLKILITGIIGNVIILDTRYIKWSKVVYLGLYMNAASSDKRNFLQD